MAYVEWHDTVRNHFKTDALMLSLGIKRREAVGIIGCLSSWAIQYRPGGVIERHLVRVAVEWEGDGEVLVEALLSAGWLDSVDAQTVKVHDWEHITGGYRKAKKDAEDRAKRRKNAVDRANVADSSAAVRGKQADSSATAAKNKRLPLREERTEREERTSGASCTEAADATSAPDATPAPVEPSGDEAHAVPYALKAFPLFAKDKKLCDRWHILSTEWSLAYSAVDVKAEMAKAHAWQQANPQRQKKDQCRFLNNWLTRAHDRAANVTRFPARDPDSEFAARRDATGPMKL